MPDVHISFVWLCSYFLSVCFFFSSRRRHTRWPRDWSSDVCSSDLPAPGRRCTRPAPPRRTSPGSPRSEERRVGKECRSQLRREHVKKNVLICVIETAIGVDIGYGLY